MSLNYRKYIRSQTKLTRTYAPTITDKYFANEEIERGMVRFYETNTNNKPIFPNPKCFLEGNYLLIVPDAYSSISAVDVVYIRDPKTLHLTSDSGDYTTTCELPEEFHEKIIDLALRLAQEVVNINELKNERSRNASQPKQ